MKSVQVLFAVAVEHFPKSQAYQRRYDARTMYSTRTAVTANHSSVVMADIHVCIVYKTGKNNPYLSYCAFCLCFGVGVEESELELIASSELIPMTYQSVFSFNHDNAD